MSGASVDLITVSREYGGGGTDFARELGARLGWPVLDQDLIARVAERLKLDPRTVTVMDEHPPGLFTRLSAALLVTRPEFASNLDINDALSPDAVADATRAAMTEAAQSPPLIVVGHGSQCLFHDRPGTFHVRLVAPLDARVERICSREPCGAGTATEQVRKLDADRFAYVRRYYQKDWRDSLLYDIQINTGRVSIGEAVAMVAELLDARGRVTTAS